MRPVYFFPLLVATTLTAAGVVRDTRVFHLGANNTIEGPAPHVAPWLGLNLASVTVDQPEYWPKERVHLRVLVPGRGGLRLTATVEKRDATPIQVPLELDADGVAVTPILDGEKANLELGEYRVDVASADGKVDASATFSVVEGQLAGLSFAREWKAVPRSEDLDTAASGWYLGSAQAGSRWGNRLSFKNELRIENEPFSGEAELIPHCMLPGCKGVVAGPTEHVHVHGGEIRGTVDVGNHSGPFQLEVVSPYGSIRHQFARSSHVERSLLAVSGGMGKTFEVSLAPYTGLVPVLGRSLFVKETAPAAGTRPVFLLASIATREASITVGATLERARAFVWRPQTDGTFKAEATQIPSTIPSGTNVRLPASGPMSVITIGGWAGGRFQEGWAMLFPPSSLRAKVELPTSAEPLRDADVVVRLTDENGAPIASSGVLEIFDNRVAAPDPNGELASALGDGVRAGADEFTSWIDPIELARFEGQRTKSEADQLQAFADGAAPFGIKSSHVFDAPLGVRAAAPANLASPHASTLERDSGRSAAQAGSDEVRRGERKVVFVGRVHTSPDGSANVRVTLPPQAGRLVARFTALRGLDWATAQSTVDVAKAATVVARIPRVVVPGARLDIRTVVQNATKNSLTLEARGPGFSPAVSRTVGAGTTELLLPWNTSAGDVTFELRDSSGVVLDRSVQSPELLGDQRVTYSRLVFGRASAAPGETAQTFDGPRELLRGVTTNIITTMQSWFPHAEAVSARIEAQAVLLAATANGVLFDDGLSRSLRAGFAADVTTFTERMIDAESGLVRPWEGMAPNVRWSRWASRNLHSALAHAKVTAYVPEKSVETIRRVLTALDAALARVPAAPEFGDGSAANDGDDIVPIEVDGKVVWRVLTDDAVQRFAIDSLAPTLDPDAADAELACAKALDRFRFLRAFSRTERALLFLEQAKAALAAGPRGQVAFERLYQAAARDLFLTKEPGLLQGPSLLGGVYSSPMAMVRFLELTIRIPTMPITRIDRRGVVNFLSAAPASWVKARVGESTLSLFGGKTELVVELDPSKNPAEYYAIIAVPSNLGVTQTEDLLADYKGRLIHGQQANGGTKAQLLTIPFRGNRRLSLLLEAVAPGVSPGFVAVRHLARPDEQTVVALPAVTVNP